MIYSKNRAFNLLVPTCEETFYIAQFKQDFERYAYVYTSSIEVLQPLHNKYQFIHHIQQLGLAAPETILLENKQELQMQLQTKRPFVLKPTFSRFADQVVINNRKKGRLVEPNLYRSWVWQSFIEGQQYCTLSMVQSGQITAHATYPIKYKAGQGSAIYFEAVEVPEIEALSKKIVESTNYTGFLALDVIYSKHDNQYYPIECNPRLTSGIHLFDHNDNFWHNERFICHPREENKMMLSLAMLLYEFPNVRSWSAFVKLVKKMRNTPDVIFDRKDWKPFFAQLWTLYYFYKLSRQQNISITAATTHHIEWNG